MIYIHCSSEYTLSVKMAKLKQFNYVFGIGTFFALLDAYNNGASM